MTHGPQALADILGARLSEDWRQAFTAVPRHLFLPDRAWRVDDDTDAPALIDRTVDPAGWLAGAYSNDSIVTQKDDQGRYTSSSSMPSMVARMLDQLDVRPGQRVLEIGTGTGWNAALLSARLGHRAVTTIEIDPTVAAAAEKNLFAAGYHPTVITGDGANGWPLGAPYDRIEATCAVQEVPWTWVEQTAPQGRILTPWSTPFGNGGLLLLTVADRRAEGHFVDTAGFMWLRAQQPDIPDEPDGFEQLATRSRTTVDPYEVLFGAGQFSLAVHLPDVRLTWDRDEDGSLVTLWLLADGASASVGLDGEVRQHGDRDLWDLAVRAHSWWIAHGNPDHTRFGLTVTEDRQWTWLDSPDQPVPARSKPGEPDHA